MRWRWHAAVTQEEYKSTRYPPDRTYPNTQSKYRNHKRGEIQRRNPKNEKTKGGILKRWNPKVGSPPFQLNTPRAQAARSGLNTPCGVTPPPPILSKCRFEGCVCWRLTAFCELQFGGSCFEEFVVCLVLCWFLAGSWRLVKTMQQIDTETLPKSLNKGPWDSKSWKMDPGFRWISDAKMRWQCHAAAPQEEYKSTRYPPDRIYPRTIT